MIQIGIDGVGNDSDEKWHGLELIVYQKFWISENKIVLNEIPSMVANTKFYFENK